MARPLPVADMLFTGLLLAWLAWIGHLPSTAHGHIARHMIVSVALADLGLAFSRSGGNAAGLIGFWALLLVEELWAWRFVRRRVGQASLRAQAHQRGRGGPALASQAWPTLQPYPTLQTEPDEEPYCEACERLGDDLFDEIEPADDVMQQLTFRTTAAGGQEISGWLRMPLAAGQRSGSLHVAFCPPLKDVPEVQAEAYSGPACRIKAAQVLPYGARLDVKLDNPAAEGDSLLVRLFATTEREGMIDFAD